MNKIVRLILFTAMEMANQRIYHILAVTLLLLPWLLLIPASLFMLDLGKVFIDLLFTALHAWLLVFLFFLGAPLIARDIEHGTCQLFLILPMPRRNYLWSRFFGFLASFIPLFLTYLISAYLAFIFAEQNWAGYFTSGSAIYFSAGAALILLPYIALTAVLFLIASLATGLPEITVFLFSVWMLCWSLPPVLHAIHKTTAIEMTPNWMIWFLKTVNQFLPDLSSSTISLYMAHTKSLSAMNVTGYCVEHIAYTAFAMSFAVVLFNRRDLA